MPDLEPSPSSRVESALAQQSTNPFIFYPVCFPKRNIDIGPTTKGAKGETSISPEWDEQSKLLEGKTPYEYPISSIEFSKNAVIATVRPSTGPLTAKQRAQCDLLKKLNRADALESLEFDVIVLSSTPELVDSLAEANATDALEALHNCMATSLALDWASAKASQSRLLEPYSATVYIRGSHGTYTETDVKNPEISIEYSKYVQYPCKIEVVPDQKCPTLQCIAKEQKLPIKDFNILRTYKGSHLFDKLELESQKELFGRCANALDKARHGAQSTGREI